MLRPGGTYRRDQGPGASPQSHFPLPPELRESRAFLIVAGDSTASNIVTLAHSGKPLGPYFEETYNQFAEGLDRPSTAMVEDEAHWRYVWASVTEAPAAQVLVKRIGRLDRFYAFRDKHRVTLFVHEHPFLLPLLLEARPAIERHFGREARVVLEVLIDPEDHPAQPVLYACVQTPLSAKEASRLLDQFDEDWWLDASENADGELCITVDFV